MSPRHTINARNQRHPAVLSERKSPISTRSTVGRCGYFHGRAFIIQIQVVTRATIEVYLFGGKRFLNGGKT